MTDPDTDDEEEAPEDPPEPDDLPEDEEVPDEVAPNEPPAEPDTPPEIDWAETSEVDTDDAVDGAAVENVGIAEVDEDFFEEAITEPITEETAADGPKTPSQSTREVVDEVRPEEMEEPDGGGQPRKTAHADEMLDALGFDVDQPVTPVPPMEEPNVDVVDLSTIRENLTFVRLLFDEEASRYLYQVIEPPLTSDQEAYLDFLRETLVRTLEARVPEGEIDWEARLREATLDAIDDHSLDMTPLDTARAFYYLERDFLGYGPIDVVMQDPMIEDISCDGPGIPIYVFHREHESTRTNIVIESEDQLDSFVRSLAQRSGRHISIAEPMLDATLPDTSRLQATLSKEVTTRGSSFTIRRFRADPLTVSDLIRLGTMNARLAAWVWMAMEAGAPMVVAGGTASGKTTTLSGVAQFIPPAKKIVTIEDTREFSVVHENWVASLTRSGGFSETDSREIDMYQLLRSSLRQRPEYLIVGEVRGSEAQTLFQAMATGHATYSTMHADSVRSAVYRLENPPIDIPRMMLQTLDAVIVQGQRRVDGRSVRRVLDVTEITGIDDSTGDLLTNQVYNWYSEEDEFEFLGRSHVLEELRRHKSVTSREIEEDWENRAHVLQWMANNGVRHITDVAQVVAAYYASPERLLDRIGEGVGAEAIPDEEELQPLDEATGEGAIE